MYRETNIISLLQKIRESVQEEVEAAPQTMTPQEDAEVETPDDMEDIEKEDLNKLDVSKKKDRKDAMKDVPDKELEIKPQESKKVKNGQLYLCNECCKTFESEEPVCSFCKSEKVEKIYEGKTKSGKRDGTGPFKNSAQRSTHGDKGKRKQAEVECPSKSREGKIPADKDAEQTKINKLIETVEELIGEVPGISTSDQKLLHWAIRNDTIPNEFPDDEIIFDALSHLADVMGVKALQDVESIDKADIHGYYLKYVLLPRARKTYSKQYRESKLKEAKDVVAVYVKQITLNRWDVYLEDSRGEDDAVRQFGDLGDARKKAEDIASVFDVPYQGVRYLEKESKLKENEGENRLNQVVKKMLTKLTNMDDRIKSDDQAVSILTTALENELENDDFWENNVIYSIDSFFEEAGGVAESKLKEAETKNLYVILDTKTNKYLQGVTEFGDRPKLFKTLDGVARALVLNVRQSLDSIEVKQIDLKPIRIIEFNAEVVQKYQGEHYLPRGKSGEIFSRETPKESKLKEAEDGYTTVANGLEKDDADKLAAEKDGMVVEDSENKDKFSVIVKEKE